MNLFDDPDDFDIEAELQRIDDILDSQPILSKDMVKIGESIISGMIKGMEE